MQLELLVSGFISLYNCPNPDVLSKVIECFNALVKILDPPEYIELVLVLKKAIKGLYTDSKKLENGQAIGFGRPEGWKPVLPILREGMLAGGVEIKEVGIFHEFISNSIFFHLSLDEFPFLPIQVSANCLAQAIQLSSDSGIKPHVVNVAGPLIRVLGEKHPSPVKIAAMNGLLKLLEKVGNSEGINSTNLVQIAK